MNYHHKLFIDYYTNPQSTETFLNGAKSYSKAYPNASDPKANAYRLTAKEDIKKAIEGRIKAISDITIEDYTGMLHKEYLNAQNKDSTRLRALELIGKVKSFVNDNASVNVSSTYVNSEDISKRIQDKVNRLASK